MDLETTQSLFLLGGIIGLTSSILGAIIDYRLAQNREDKDGLPGCIFMVTGSLGFMGFVVLIISVLVEGSLRRPMITGGGVITGFLFGFVLMLSAWFFLDRRRSS